jgi:hypothetical protein
VALSICTADVTAPRLMTDRIASAPTRNSSMAGPLTMTASHCLPTSRLPMRAARFSE